MNIKLLAVAALGAFATACASTPPAEEPEAPIERPVETVDNTPVVDQGPIAGSREHDLSAEARETLRRQAAWLASYPDARILIAGNCDERGTREYNLALGARRANAARDFLITQGVEPARISTTS